MSITGTSLFSWLDCGATFEPDLLCFDVFGESGMTKDLRRSAGEVDVAVFEGIVKRFMLMVADKEW